MSNTEAMELITPLYATLPTAPPAQPPMNPWQRAIDEALIVSCLDCTSDAESPKKALARLVSWEVDMALDPAISERAAALLDARSPIAGEPKDHEIRELVSALVKVARDYHGAEQLRSRIQEPLLPFLARYRAAKGDAS